ncbi:MAG: hypothetical protein CMM01_13135 [Rhodopirellula sp.]|nr:hypothetical protein [Rhodopirellula sp.]
MIISNCPRCQEVFRVPLGTLPDDAYAICPWCHETFPLAEVLDHLPPALEILTADGEPIPIMEPVDSHYAAGIQSLTGTSVGTSDHLQTHNTSGGGQPWDPATLDFGAESGQIDGGWNASGTPQAAPMSVSPRPNRRKKGASGIRSMVQVVVGGLLSVPIALAILLAVGRAPDLGFWPFDGQKRSPRELLPFLDDANTDDEMTLPSFDGQQLDTSDFDEVIKETEDPGQSALDQIFAPVESPEPDDQSTRNRTKPTNPNQTASLEVTENTLDPLQPDERKDAPELPNNLPNTGTDSIPLNAPEPANSQNNNPDSATAIIAASQTRSSERLGDHNAESKLIDSVPAQAMTEVTTAIQAIERLDADNQIIDTDILAETYEKIARACETVQKYPAALSSLANAVTQSRALNQIQEAAVTWLDYPRRSAQGIVLIGKPGTTAKSQILTLDSGRILTISSKLSLPLAEKVVVLGRITKDPDKIEVDFTAPVLP